MPSYLGKHIIDTQNNKKNSSPKS